MTPESALTLLGTGILLYAETHYSFKGVYSRLKKRQPEIVADAPHRIEPGEAVPILLIVKDAHLHPVRLHAVTVSVSAANGNVWRQNFPLDDLAVRDPLWWRIFEIDPPERGRLSLDVQIDYQAGRKKLRCCNDNYAGTSHEPLSVWVATEPLPRESGWVHGDLHTHSSFTHDQVEFGAPLAASIRLAKALGLRFFAATDHSYDLDDHPDDYLKHDPELSKWHTFWAEVEAINRGQHDVVVLPGEEISCSNARGRNVHFLVLNSRRFFPGSGDSAERWLRTTPEMSIGEVLSQLDGRALAIAAHPSVRPPFLEWLLVRRGFWEDTDCEHPRLAGLQAWNGSERGLQEGLEQWVRCLLSGQRLFLFGGNDAHGNFNRYRQIGFPFFTMREHHDHLFGKVRTAVRIEGEPSVESILAGLRSGCCIVTDGPFVTLELQAGEGPKTPIGGTAAPGDGRLWVRASSTPEFGPLRRLRVYRGKIGSDREEVQQEFARFDDAFAFAVTVDVAALEARSYLRVEVESGDRQDPRRAFSNPIWMG